MKIEQAKALKVGEMVFTSVADGVANMTNFNHYKIEKLYLPLITIAGNDGRFIDVSISVLTPVKPQETPNGYHSTKSA